MRIKLHYGYESVEVEIPNRNILAVLEPRKVKGEDVDTAIKSALRNPINGLDLASIVRSKRRVLVIIDDYTRETPTSKILPIMIKELMRLGIKRKDIDIMMALGTHRLPSKEEIYNKVGDIADEHELLFHDWKHDEMIYLGRSPRDIPIYLNKKILKYEILIGIGMIVPHRVSGYSGGSKIIQPGISGAETTGHTHWLSAMIPVEEILGIVRNKVREEMDYVADVSRLRAVINVIMRGSKVARAFFGNHKEVYERGADVAREVYGVNLKERADIVIAECPPPKDIDMWQAAKALYSAAVAVKKSGSIILLAKCTEGISREHPEVEIHGYHTYEEVKRMLDEGEINDLIAAAHIAHVGEIIKKKAKCYLVSDMARKTVEKVGFIYVKSCEEALEEAIKEHGTSSKIVIIKNAPDMLPIVGEEYG
ncbi:MAG: nickel-dependent lactate racemase [Thermoprotei archaeon]|nr:MAG: nickel-dependent lactate racemase [Thermoprotei archaeon]